MTMELNNLRGNKSRLPAWGAGKAVGRDGNSMKYPSVIRWIGRSIDAAELIS
jgi:hypothetical protein